MKSFHCIYFLSHKLHEESRSKSRSVSMLQVPLIENSLILNRTLVSGLLPPLFSFMSIFYYIRETASLDQLACFRCH